MKQKKSAALWIISVILLTLGIAAGVWGRGDSVKTAASYEELVLGMDTDAETYHIGIWRNGGGTYHFFLPAAADLNRLYFVNIDEDAPLLLNGFEVRRNMPLAGIVDCGEPCTLQMKGSQEGLEPVEVVFHHSENIASMFLEMESEDFQNILSDRQLKVSASVSLIDAEGRPEYSDSLEYVRTRGNSTFVETDKKSFQVKLRREESLLGMAPAEKWILMAQSFDGSFMRNELVNSFAGKNTDIPAQSGDYVDLYVNGEYYGLFYLCEKVEVGEGRLDIRDLEALDADLNGSQNAAGQYASEDGKIRAVLGGRNPKDITGGYLVELVAEGEHENYPCGFRTNGGKSYKVVSPQNATREQVEYICGLFDEMEEAFDREDGICPATGKHYSEYLDVSSWVDKYVLEEVFHDPDGSAASAFFYKDSDAVDPLIHAGPMWDYDRAMGSYALPDFYQLDNPRQVLYCSAYASSWMQREEIRQMVQEEFGRLFSDGNMARLEADSYDIEDKISAAVLMDGERWTWTRRYYESLSANRAYVVSFLQSKVEFLKDVWLDGTAYHTVTFLDYDGNVWAQYFIRHGDLLPEKPTIACYVALFNGWYSRETGKRLEMQLPVLEDVTYESQWIDMELLVLNTLGISEVDLQQVNVEELQGFVDQLKVMQQN